MAVSSYGVAAPAAVSMSPPATAVKTLEVLSLLGAVVLPAAPAVLIPAFDAALVYDVAAAVALSSTLAFAAAASVLLFAEFFVSRSLDVAAATADCPLPSWLLLDPPILMTSLKQKVVRQEGKHTLEYTKVLSTHIPPAAEATQVLLHCCVLLPIAAYHDRHASFSSAAFLLSALRHVLPALGGLFDAPSLPSCRFCRSVTGYLEKRYRWYLSRS